MDVKQTVSGIKPTNSLNQIKVKFHIKQIQSLNPGSSGLLILLDLRWFWSGVQNLSVTFIDSAATETINLVIFIFLIVKGSSVLSVWVQNVWFWIYFVKKMKLKNFRKLELSSSEIQQNFWTNNPGRTSSLFRGVLFWNSKIETSSCSSCQSMGFIFSILLLNF